MTGPDECSRIGDLIPEFLAGRVSEEDDRRVREHLAGCADCRQRANAVSLLQQTPLPQPDPDRWKGFVEGVVDAADRGEASRRRRRLARWALVVLVGAIALVLLWTRLSAEAVPATAIPPSTWPASPP